MTDRRRVFDHLSTVLEPCTPATVAMFAEAVERYRAGEATA